MPANAPIERDRLRAERIGKSASAALAPQNSADDKRTTVARPRFGGRKRERQIGLRRRMPTG